MKILAIAAFDPASVVLSHRDLMRAAGHDFRLAVIRAYTDRQAQADWYLERCAFIDDQYQTKLEVLERREIAQDFFEFYREADVIQWHPGIGLGVPGGPMDASDGGVLAERLDPIAELTAVAKRFGLAVHEPDDQETVIFVHGSMNMRRHITWWRERILDWAPHGASFVASTIDYAIDLDAGYLPPFVDVGSAVVPDPSAPLMIAHMPTDFEACSTKRFLELCVKVGVPVRFLHGQPHEEVIKAKRECNAGFDHMRGGFSVNTLENACLGIVPLFKDVPGALPTNVTPVAWVPSCQAIGNWGDLEEDLRDLKNDTAYRCDRQREARAWYDRYFSSGAVTKRLLDFYGSLV